MHKENLSLLQRLKTQTSNTNLSRSYSASADVAATATGTGAESACATQCSSLHLDVEKMSSTASVDGAAIVDRREKRRIFTFDGLLPQVDSSFC